MTRNSRSIAQIGRAIRPKSQSPWVYSSGIYYNTPQRSRIWSVCNSEYNHKNLHHVMVILRLIYSCYHGCFVKQPLGSDACSSMLWVEIISN